LKQTMDSPAKPSKTTSAAPAAPSVSREERLTAWLTANARFVAIGAAAVVLVVLVTWFMAASGRRKANFARQALESAWGSADAGNIPQASAELQRVAATYRGTEAAVEATLSLNQTRLIAGQNQLAVDDLRRFLQDRPPARFVASGNMLLGAALENLGKSGEAAEAYMAASAAAEMSHTKAEALLAAGRTYRAAGQNDKAIHAYRTVVDQHKETAAFPIAEVRLGELVK